MSNMTAVLLLRRRVVVADDAFVEIVIWRLPKALPPSRHMFKYRLAYVVDGDCVVRYDNEQGKGDHRHYEARETRFCFSDPETLIADFEADIRRWNDENGRS